MGDYPGSVSLGILFLPWSGAEAFRPGVIPLLLERKETMALLEKSKTVQRLQAAVETPAKQAVTIAVAALVIALAALALAAFGGRS